MGYESRFYLATTLEGHAYDVHATDENGHWTPEKTGRKALSAQKVAMVDVSKAGYETPVGLLIRESINIEKARLATSTEGVTPPGYGLYISGNEFADRDPYDDPISPVDLDALITALEADLAGEWKYRRFVLLLGVLKTWREVLPDFPGAVVLHYGH